ncbi:unnamed protein product [Amoebophrya sp. A25]|nr:unnamed protein product [Amoebophrya sp. A25]|eukprot:GSA25T00023625001.1
MKLWPLLIAGHQQVSAGVARSGQRIALSGQRRQQQQQNDRKRVGGRKQTPVEAEAARQAELEAEANAAAASLGSAPPVAIKTGKYGTEGAIGKVIKLLMDMKKNVLGDNERDKRMYDQFACFCKEEGAARGTTIEDAKTRLTELTKLIGTSSSLITEAELQIAFETKNIAKEKKKQEKLTKRMDEDDADFNKRKGENIETLNVLTKAVSVLSKPRSFLQTEREERQRTLALVQQLTGKSVGEGTMGQATGYLVDLKKQTAVDLQGDTIENVNARKSYTKEMLLSEQAIAEHEFIKKTQEGILAENMKLKGEYVEEYNAVKQKMDADVEFFDNMQADCNARSKFYSQQVTDAESEISAIEATLPILESIMAGDNAPSPTFVQVRSTLGSRVDKVSRSIHRLPVEMKRAVMAFLSQSDATALSATEKIVKKCEDMITTLQKEIMDTDEAKNTCVETTHNLEMAKETATQVKVAAEDAVTATKQDIRFVDDEVKKVIGDIAVNEKTKSDLDTTCAQTASTLKTQKEELTAEKAAVEAATEKLAEAYGDDALAALKEHEHFTADYNNQYNAMASNQTKTEQATDFTDQNARRSGGAKIVTMLLMIKDNLAKNLADTIAEAEESENSCIKGKAELILAHEKLTDLKNEKTDEKVTLSKKLKTEKLDLESKTTEETNAQQALEDYGNCAQKIEVYNNAMLARQTDIDSINEVIHFLQTISADTDGAVSLVDDTDLTLADYK